MPRPTRRKKDHTTKAERSSSRETLGDWIDDRVRELDEQYALKEAGFEPRTHVPTGLRRLDDAGLLEPGVATVVLGHEGDGKSALGLRFARGAAEAGLDVSLYVPEDPRRFVADRVLAQATGESATRLRRLKLDDPHARLRAARDAGAAWTRRVRVSDARVTADRVCEEVRAEKPGLAIVDYAQVLAGADESDAERVLARAVWDLNEIAKETGGAVVVMSQVRTKVKERGRDWFDRWRYKNPGPVTRDAVEGYRPMPGDAQWAPNALGQKPRAVLAWFRPGLWMKQHGAGVEDDVAELTVIKSSYGPGGEIIRLRWHGPTTEITDPKE